MLLLLFDIAPVQLIENNPSFVSSFFLFRRF